MQRKLKSVFRRSSQSRSSSGQHELLESNAHNVEASPPRGDRHRVSSDRHGRTSVDSSVTGSVYAGRSRPVSSVYDDLPRSTKHMAATDSVPSSDINGGAIANDYKAYLPALSPVNDDHSDDYITLNGSRQHEEDVADRNIARYSTSIDGGSRASAGTAHNGAAGTARGAPASNLSPGQKYLNERADGAGSFRSVLGSIPTGAPIAKHLTLTANGSLVDGTRLHTEKSPREKGSWTGSSSPPKTARAEPGWEKREPRISGSNDDASQSPQRTHKAQGSQSGVRHATMDGTADGEETALARKLREDGIVDLSNTVDTDGDITWAPAVTHEVIKPHQHERIQHKIYREIHNYEHFHRIQPVTMTEVLPPRHWIPNPDGEGLLEISADELPARTGENRWWSICEHPSPYSRQATLPKYRTEPEIIEAGTFMTEGGYERMETIIIHPPTLADLTGYGGPVQAMHFDHKTGKSWMGELTTMDKLHELQQELDLAPDTQAFEMGGLAQSLPNVPSDSARRGSHTMPPRKPVSGQSSKMHGSNVGRKMSAA